MSSEEVNEYEALRLAKIARNEARLRELGLMRSDSLQRKQDAKIRAPNKQEERPKISPKRLASGVPLRRSKRVRASTVNYKVDSLTRSSHNPQQSRREDEAEEEDTHNDQDYLQVEGEPKTFDEDSVEKPERASRLSPETSISLPMAPPPLVPLSPNSAKAMNLDLAKLLTDSMVGKTLCKNGKAHVMEESARLAVDGYSGSPISFNKYSGVQEWGNSVLFLWINLQSPNSDVTNDFPVGGKNVTWYGSSRMHERTPAIQRLLSVGRGATRGGVVLWCRRYLKERKNFEPYTCLGRLSYVSHEPESQPLAFVWKLEDFDRITNHADKARREMFRSMVQVQAY